MIRSVMLMVSESRCEGCCVPVVVVILFIDDYMDMMSLKEHRVLQLFTSTGNV